MSVLVRGGRWASRPPHRGGVRRRGKTAQHAPIVFEADDFSIVCFVQSKQTLGVSVYHADVSEIHVVELEVDDNYSHAAAVKDACGPSMMVVTKSLTQNPAFVRAVLGDVTISERMGSNENGDEDSTQQTTTGSRTENDLPQNESSRIEVLSSSNEANRGKEDDENADEKKICIIPASDCTVHKAYENISTISVLSMSEIVTGKERISFLAHIFDGHEVALRATGGLISFCFNKSILFAGDGQDTVSINAIKYGTLGLGMQISSNSTFALQVFQQDSHPAGRGIGKGKEWGLFGIIASETKSKASQSLLRSWMRSPLIDVEDIVGRQIVVTALRSPANQNFMYNLRDALKSVKNVPNVLARIRNIAASVSDWSVLLSSTKAFMIILDSFKNMARADMSLLNTTLFERARKIDLEQLRDLVKSIDDVVDFEESDVENRLVVRDGFNDEVDELRQYLASIDSVLTQVGIDEMKRLLREKPDDIELSSLIYHFDSNIGYSVQIEVKDIKRYGLERLKNAGFEFHHAKNEEKLFKDKKCYELDDEIGDIRGSLVSIEDKVVQFLELKVGRVAETVYNASKIVAEIDCLQAMASAAEEYKWIRPVVSEDAIGIRIENGRHCLLELSAPTIVPNSTNIRLGDVNVITGPNAAGKSVYMKQVALIVYLAQIGSCVPADAAEIHPVSAIFTRISSFDSILKGRSSFFSDCAQVAGFLRSDKKPILAVLDEFGKGTSNLEGIALCAAVLRSVLQRGNGSKMCMCATHQVEIFNNNMLPLDNAALGTYSMEMVAVEEYDSAQKAQKTDGSSSPSEARVIEKETRFVRTYRLLPGSICSESRAVQCALENGVSRDILARAMQIKAAAAAPLPTTSEASNGDHIAHISMRSTRAKKNSQVTQRFISYELNSFESTATPR